LTGGLLAAPLAAEAQRLYDLAVDLALTDPSGVDLSHRDACMNVLRMRYGNERAEKIVGRAQAAVRQLGPKVSRWLDDTGLGNSPAVLFALAEIGGGASRMSKQEAARKLALVRADGKYQSGDKYAVDHAAFLARIAYETEDEFEAPKPM
jgi:hypothetical protein